MSDSDFEKDEEMRDSPSVIEQEFEDTPILCIDCSQQFIWTAGEQLFFRVKNLLNPPKRCKDCKKAKTRRLEAIEMAQLTGTPHKIEVRANCAKCNTSTTVPFYPSQGRPVYCRQCFIGIKDEMLNRETA